MKFLLVILSTLAAFAVTVLLVLSDAPTGAWALSGGLFGYAALEFTSRK